jgi:hypothetical protein
LSGGLVDSWRFGFITVEGDRVEKKFTIEMTMHGAEFVRDPDF